MVNHEIKSLVWGRQVQGRGLGGGAGEVEDT